MSADTRPRGRCYDPDYIDNAELREYIQRHQIGTTHLARELGHTRMTADSTRVREALGLRLKRCERGHYNMKNVSVELAEPLCEALGIPVPPARRGKVPNEPLREAFLASGMTAYALAKAVGWNKASADSSRVARALGMLRNSATVRNGKRYVPGFNTRMPYDLAVRIAHIVGADPVEVGV